MDEEDIENKFWAEIERDSVICKVHFGGILLLSTEAFQILLTRFVGL